MTCTQMIIWLDENATDSVSSFRSKLTENNHQCVEIFTEIDPCITFIQTHVHQTIFFILSGSCALKVVPLIYDCENIHQIYLFCGSMTNYTNWATDYIDKMLMYDHEDDLLQRLFTEIEEHLRQQAEQYLKQANSFKDRAQLLKQDQCG